MRCEGGDSPPCKRCRTSSLECLFEKPSKDPSLTGEAGIECIRSLEAHVAEIRHTQTSIQSSVAEILSHLRQNLRGGGIYSSSPHQSPSLHSPLMPAPPAAHQHVSDALPTPPGSFPNSSQPSPDSYSHYPAHGQGYTTAGQSNQNFVLPPFSSLRTMGLPVLQKAKVRFDNGHSRPTPRQRRHPGSSGKRHAPGAIDVTRTDSFDIEEDTEVLRGWTDVASEQTAKKNGDSSGPQSRPRTPSPANKRRKIPHEGTPRLIFPDGVTKNILEEMAQVSGQMHVVSGLTSEGTPGTGPSMVNLAEEETDEDEWAVRVGNLPLPLWGGKRRAGAEADYWDTTERKRPRLNASGSPTLSRLQPCKDLRKKS
ncbi:hypothetical protein B0H10DRAFT_1208401 [Mycena sp. CBHHK59/15]|nr:hypothetical protein B0H10DRAFT_1208401 [Mycena sp. CBHHK59/15]